MSTLDNILSTLSQREYACIQLKLPRSGNPELDELIRLANLGGDVITREEQAAREDHIRKAYRTQGEGIVGQLYSDPSTGLIAIWMKEGWSIVSPHASHHYSTVLGSESEGVEHPPKFELID